MAPVWYADQLSRLGMPDRIETLFEVLVNVAEGLDFEYCGYWIRMPTPFSNPIFHILSNYPTEWQKEYNRRQYISIDPVVHHGLRSRHPMLWADHVFKPSPEFWNHARSVGLRFGWGQSSQSATGIVGIIQFARSRGPVSKIEFREKKYGMTAIINFAHERMSQILTSERPEMHVHLSDRETEILKWTADGKNSEEIALILTISPRTVNFHISNSLAKLKASNKTSASVKAAMLGLLY